MRALDLGIFQARIYIYIYIYIYILIFVDEFSLITIRKQK